MKEIKLTRGYVAIVDDDDFERVSQRKWYASGAAPYIYASSGSKTSKARILKGHNDPDDYISLHRFIASVGAGAVVDHINRDTLDNRKENLRVCSQSENIMNSKFTKARFKGVSLDGRRKTFSVAIQGITLRGFSTESDAARAYDQIAKKLFGEYAYLNKIGPKIF